ncbi:MAG: DegQ family serine endoprotease, partial [Thermodesulfobacteriota bacterium]
YRKKVFGIKTLFVVALLSIAAGIFITAGLDLTDRTGAQNFWHEPTEAAGAKASASAPVVLHDFTGLAKRLTPTVVNISTTQTVKQRPMPFPRFKGPFDDFFKDFEPFFNEPPREFKRQSLGSGFIINKDGYILTNNHVIENASEIMVTLSGHKQDYKAKVIGRDKNLDIALIKIEASKDLPVVTLGDSDKLEVGEWTLAIGNPFGLGGTVTAGIISQKGRIIGAGPYDNFIQTDASINPGNSGGPLFNMRGEVVGINTAIVAGGQGIGFATPINMAKDVLLQLKEFGHVTRGWIGVGIQAVTPELARSFGLKEAKGVLVSSVTPGDPADIAGVKTGDIIVAFDGKPVKELNDLPRVVAATPPGKKIKLKVIRDGREKTLFIKVAKKKEEGAVEKEKKESAPDEKLGIDIQPLTPEIADRLGIKESRGVYISYVKPGSPASKAGLRRGDMVKEINRKPVKNLSDYNAAIKEASGRKDILFLIRRGPNTIYVVLKVGK